MDRQYLVFHVPAVNGGTEKPNARGVAIASFPHEDCRDDSDKHAHSPYDAAMKSASEMASLLDGDQLVVLEAEGAENAYPVVSSNSLIYAYTVRMNGVRLETVGGGRL